MNKTQKKIGTDVVMQTYQWQDLGSSFDWQSMGGRVCGNTSANRLTMTQ